MALTVEVHLSARDGTQGRIETLKAKLEDLGRTASGPTTAGIATLDRSISTAGGSLGNLSAIGQRVTGALGTLAEKTGLGGAQLNRLTGIVGTLGGTFGSIAGRLGGFVAGLTGAVGPIGLLAAGATALILKLRSMNEEADKTLTAVGRVNAEITANFRAAQADLAVLDARASGDRVALAEATASKVILTAQQERERKIREAEASTKGEVELQAIRVAADAEASLKILQARRELTADLDKIAQEQAATVQRVAAAAADAANSRAQIEAKASGDILGVIELERQQKLASIQAAISAAAAGSAERLIAERTALDKIVTAEIEAAEKRKQAIAGFVSEALRIVDGLGPGFERFREQLQIVDAIEKNAKALKTLEQLAKAVPSLTDDITEAQDRLRAQGEELARGVLPRVAKGFDDGGRAARRMADEVLDVADAIRELSSGAEDIRIGERLDDANVALIEAQGALAELDAIQRQALNGTLELGEGWRDVGRAVRETGDAIAEVGVKLPDIFDAAVDEILAASATAISSMQGIAASAEQSIASLRQQLTRVSEQAGRAGEGAAFQREIRDLQDQQRAAEERGDRRQAQIIQNQIDQLQQARAAKLDQERATAQTQAILERIRQIEEQAASTLFQIANQNVQQQIAPPRFPHGGIVPGPVGVPRIIQAEGGEVVLNPRQQRALLEGTPGNDRPTVVLNLVGTHVIESRRALKDLSQQLERRLVDLIRRGG